ncbi:exodeoxyribonuclease V subunit alpha [Mariniluteicoccus flavus]
MTADLVLDAPGLLGEFARAGVLGPADVHTARRLGEIWEEPDESVRLALAVAVRALRGGSVCVDITDPGQLVLDTEASDSAAADATIHRPDDQDTTPLTWPEPEEWRRALTDSPAVTLGVGELGDRPLRLVGDLLYLERYWGQEQAVRHQLQTRQTLAPPLADLAMVNRTLAKLFDGSDLPEGQPDLQRLAAAMAAASPVTVIAGGPGTGKTTTVAKVLALLASVGSLAPTVALAAPTGKAAARLEEAVRDAAAGLGEPWRTRVGDQRARTLHRLLGGFRPPFRHHAGNPLPYDVVVVDEMSMVSLSMMAHLLEAVRPDARLVLVGDPDQLASVEAGAVMADITRAEVDPNPALEARVRDLAVGDRPAPPAPRPGVVTLQHTWRFDGGIDTLARAIRVGDADATLDVLRAGLPELSFTEVDLSDPARQTETAAVASLRRRIVEASRPMHAAALAGDVSEALAGLDAHRVLCAHRRGPFGVAWWGRRVEDWLREDIEGYGVEGEWYPGLPLIVNANDADAGLYNGDTGVLVETDAGLRGAFARGGTPALYSTIQLDQAGPVHAMTVHKSQGSQFRGLTFIVPPLDSPLLTRELLYTAVTRASERVEVFGTAEAIRRAVERPANRASGLGRRIG